MQATYFQPGGGFFLERDVYCLIPDAADIKEQVYLFFTTIIII
jgi:hypothetical protein